MYFYLRLQKEYFMNLIKQNLILSIFILLGFMSAATAEGANQLIEIKVNELTIYKKEGLFGIEEERVKLNYELSNKYKKLIKLADHRLVTKDLLGDIVTIFRLEQDIYLPSNVQKSFVRDSDMDWLSYNPYRLRKIKLEDLVFEYEVKSIVFEDNVTLNIE